jgi:hypothetical protein
VTAGLSALSCVSFGIGFRLRADSELLLPAMLECAPLGTESLAECPGSLQEFTLLGSDGGAGYRLVVGDEVVAEAAEIRDVLDKLREDLMVYVANHAPDRVFVHAGVVGWRGHALVLPGTSFAGKTTLVAALVRAGATYYSDEYAVLDERGCVHPYARVLQMREAGGSEQMPVAVEELGGRAGTAPLAVSHVVFTEYEESGRWDPQPVSAGMAVLEMLRHSIPVQRTPARVMATLAKMMESAIALRSARGDARATARVLLDSIDAKD